VTPEQIAGEAQPLTESQEREAFETWARNMGFAARRTLPTDAAYNDSSSHIMWEAWRARAALATHPAPAEPALEETRRAVAAIAVVGQIDGHDVVRRLSVLDIIDRRRAHPAPSAAPAQPDVPNLDPDDLLSNEEYEAARERWLAQHGRAAPPAAQPVAPTREAVGQLARALLDEWKRVDPRSNVAQHPESYVANFADMARLVLATHPPAVQPVVPTGAQIRAALAHPGCDRLREWATIGPVQRAAVELFADLIAAAPSAALVDAEQPLGVPAAPSGSALQPSVSTAIPDAD
jgi:hypothetical protein